MVHVRRLFGVGRGDINVQLLKVLDCVDLLIHRVVSAMFDELSLLGLLFLRHQVFYILDLSKLWVICILQRNIFCR